MVSSDGGPDFHCKVTSICVRPKDNTLDEQGPENESEETDCEEGPDIEHLCPDLDEQPNRSSIQSAAVITFTVHMERSFRERGWDAFRRSKDSKPQSALLREAEAKGDVYFVTQVSKGFPQF